MRIKNLYFLLSLIILLPFSVDTNANYQFRTLSPEGGFYFDGVSDIQQDNEGFIWVLMENNLYRFDGYQYKQYHNYFTDINPELEWKFRNITIDSKGVLLVNTTNGLFRYDRTSDIFNLLYEGSADIVQVDNHDNIWIKTNNKWCILNKSDKSLNTPLYDGEEVSFIGNVFCLHNDDLYVCSNYGRIYRFNYQKNEFSLCLVLPKHDGLVRDMKVYKGKLWVFVQKYGLYKIDLSTHTVEDNFAFYTECSESPVKTFHIDKNGNIWIGNIEGLYILNSESKEWSHYCHSESDPFSLTNNSIWIIKEDLQKNIWIGTYSGGLCYVNLDEKIPFKSYIPYKGQLNQAPVSAFADDRDCLWIGTEGGGINCLNKKTGEFTYLSHSVQSNSLSFNNVKSLVLDKKNNLWVGMYQGGIDCYNTKTKQFKHFRHTNDKNSLFSNNIRKIIPEEDSGFWITYQYKEATLSYYSFKDETFHHFTAPEDKKDYIFDIVRGRENRLWMINSNHLFLFDIKEQTFRTIKPAQPVFMNFYTFCLDDSGNLWIGTLGKGLVKFNPNTSEFTVFEDILGKNISAIYAISYDEEGYLWLGTDNGLIRYDTANNSYSKFDEKDGVQGPVFYHLASSKGTNGELYFGGTNGFSVIDPKAVSLNIYRPKVIISDFLIDHVPSKVNLSSNEIVLNYDQNNFGFRFSSDNYLIPEKNHFKYRLRGYDNRWIQVDAFNRTAMYSKVPAGTYYFEVVASNNDDVWNNQATIIKIIRKPAPWLSWPAYILYFLILLSLTYIIIRYFNEKKKFKMQLYLDNLEKEKKEEIHQAQLRFFTNISHDFRTPLSLILASIEKLRQEGIKEYYYKILHSNAQRLLNLVNELMDFRTIENKKMKLELQLTDINKFVKEIASDFIDYAKQRNIRFQIKTDSEALHAFIDQNILEKIIMNLLNNAFKYTKAGTISIEVYAESGMFQSAFSTNFTVKEDNGINAASCFAVAIKDTGVGISEDSIKNVFERFYKVNTINFDSHLGTGIGLALVKSFTLLHKGIIGIFSEREKGTDMVVFLSKDSSIYDSADFVKQENIPSEKEKAEPFTEKEDKNTTPEYQVINKAKKQILLVEDNDDLRKFISDFLENDYGIIQAEDGMKASELLASERIDLVISDIMMPKKDGITLSKEIKTNIETSHIPLILLTAKTSAESKLEGADSGADMYFEKPVDMQLLKLSIQNIFNHQQQLKEYYSKNYFSDGSELSANEKDAKFLRKFIEIIDANLAHPDMDVNYIASELSMSRSKLYRKIKTMTDKSIIEFILSYKLKKAAALIIENNLSIREIMDRIGIESQAYFTNSFKKEFGETPTAFLAKHKSS